MIPSCRALGLIDGVLVVNKPPGMTSHDVVDAARRLFRTRRVGHTGTLDPDATGVLVLCLGQATRLVEYLTAARKQYVTEIMLGLETDTQDASGQITAERAADGLTEEALAGLLTAFRGTITQIPPMVSARRHEGQRLYVLARAGVTVEREARSVHIESLEMTDFTPGPVATATLVVTCSTGTYIRTLAADIGAAAGVGGTMKSLLRTWIGEPTGPFTLSRARTLDELRDLDAAGSLSAAVVPMEDAVAEWPQVELDDGQAVRFRMGQPLFRTDLRNIGSLQSEIAQVAILDSDRLLCGVGRLDAEQLHPAKVLNRAAAD